MYVDNCLTSVEPIPKHNAATFLAKFSLELPKITPNNYVLENYKININETAITNLGLGIYYFYPGNSAQLNMFATFIKTKV